MNGEVYLAALHGLATKPLTEPLLGVLRRLLAGSPALVWAEPAQRRDCLRDFPCLWSDPAAVLACLDGVQNIALEEARLFWPKGAMHLVAAGRGHTRWMAFWEPDHQPRPNWLAPLVSDAAVAGERLGPFHRSVTPVLTMQANDRTRYGLRPLSCALKGGLTLTQFRRGTDLVLWNLEEVSKHE
jgi:hypothetical protein